MSWFKFCFTNPTTSFCHLGLMTCSQVLRKKHWTSSCINKSSDQDAKAKVWVTFHWICQVKRHSQDIAMYCHYNRYLLQTLNHCNIMFDDKNWQNSTKRAYLLCAAMEIPTTQVGLPQLQVDNQGYFAAYLFMYETIEQQACTARMFLKPALHGDQCSI